MVIHSSFSVLIIKKIFKHLERILILLRLLVAADSGSTAEA
jgi:hypothetical protein